MSFFLDVYACVHACVRGGLGTWWHMYRAHADPLCSGEELARCPAMGIVTLEGVIEELIQEEILDETDQGVDVVSPSFRILPALFACVCILPAVFACVCLA